MRAGKHKFVLQNSNAHQKMHVHAKIIRLGLKFFVKYQLKQFGQSQRREKNSGLIPFL
jgi:hypothetical protein